MTRLANWTFGLQQLPNLMGSATQRQLLADMRRFLAQLPSHVQQPMPHYMAQLGQGNGYDLPVNTIRQLADFAALLNRTSPLGICMRRSLLRYHYLRPHLPITVQFGARFETKAVKRTIAGHAWVLCADEPYFESSENYQNFTVIYRWPADSAETTIT